MRVDDACLRNSEPLFSTYAIDFKLLSDPHAKDDTKMTGRPEKRREIPSTVRPKRLVLILTKSCSPGALNDHGHLERFSLFVDNADPIKSKTYSPIV